MAVSLSALFVKRRCLAPSCSCRLLISRQSLPAMLSSSNLTSQPPLHFVERRRRAKRGEGEVDAAPLSITHINLPSTAICCLLLRLKFHFPLCIVTISSGKRRVSA